MTTTNTAATLLYFYKQANCTWDQDCALLIKDDKYGIRLAENVMPGKSFCFTCSLLWYRTSLISNCVLPWKKTHMQSKTGKATSPENMYF